MSEAVFWILLSFVHFLIGFYAARWGARRAMDDAVPPYTGLDYGYAGLAFVAMLFMWPVILGILGLGLVLVRLGRLVTR